MVHEASHRPVIKVHIYNQPDVHDHVHSLMHHILIDGNLRNRDTEGIGEYYSGRLETSCNLKIDGQNDTFLMT